MAMAPKFRFFISLLVAIFVTCWHFEYGDCMINRDVLDLVTVTLYKDTKFMSERPEQMNVDAIFGLSFVEAHTNAILNHKNVIYLKQINRQRLDEISKLCKLARMNSKDVLSSSAFESLIRPELWNRTIIWRRGALGRRPSVSPGLTEARASSLIFEGSPVEAESSRCLGDLIDKHRNTECAVSNNCAEMLVRKDSSRGYPLTHRLLYVQAAIALECKENSRAPFAKLTKDYCTAILQDLVDVEAANFPPPSSDLAMEQILLCGMEGYLEFANAHYAKLITSWPNSHGCYSALGFHNTRTHRAKKSTAFMDYGCDNHASGVAAACLSLLIRAAVENIHETSH